MILDLTYSYKNIYIIDHTAFGDKLNDDLGRWDKQNSCANTRDALHLGKKGLKLFAANIKSSVFRRSQSKSRFSGGGGHYRDAAARGERGQDGNR